MCALLQPIRCTSLVGSVAKKVVATRPHCHSSPAPCSPAVEKGSVILALPTPLTAARATSAALRDEAIKEGALVRVRTRVSKICAGGLTIHLVLRLNAIVVSADEDGFLDVIYEVKFPSDDPLQIVRVARDQVKVMPSDNANAAAPCSASTKSKEKGAPRPTTAGKSLRLLTKVLEEERKLAGATMPS
uniref:Uncharacterized protein n=1 Tax=Leersia perrieri TaxID=77586 RepID=A0A0D9WZ79_9ORYZ